MVYAQVAHADTPRRPASRALTVVTVPIGAVVVAAVLFLAYARIFGFDPGRVRPGLWLSGEVVTQPVGDWSFAHKLSLATSVQSRQWFLPILPHSVNIGRFHHGTRMYIGTGYPAGIKPPQGRAWNRNVLADPNVRIRVAGKLYDVKLVEVTDAAERDDVLRSADSGVMMDMYWAPGYYLHLWRVEPRG